MWFFEVQDIYLIVDDIANAYYHVGEHIVPDRFFLLFLLCLILLLYLHNDKKLEDSIHNGEVIWANFITIAEIRSTGCTDKAVVLLWINVFFVEKWLIKDVDRNRLGIL